MFVGLNTSDMGIAALINTISKAEAFMCSEKCSAHAEADIIETICDFDQKLTDILFRGEEDWQRGDGYPCEDCDCTIPDKGLCYRTDD